MPAPKNREYQLTHELLQQYRDAALVNAQALLEEAALLLQHDHHARAYFLAVASIEEIGKAVQASDGMGRHLQDSAVSTRLKLQFADHSQKITSAFVPWLLAIPNLREEVLSFNDLMIHVKRGRKRSMYTDIDVEGPSVITPSTSIRQRAAEDCVRLAQDVLAYARPYVTQAHPKVTTRVQDAYFAMRPAVFQKMLKMRDFWEYYISCSQAGDRAWETAVIQYHNNYLSKGLPFKAESGSA
jgi:AbiV family abortive infection protein